MPTKRSTQPNPINAAAVLKRLGIGKTNPGVFDGEWSGAGKKLESTSPNDGSVLAEVRTSTPEEYDRVSSRARTAFAKWQTVPAPKRGEIVRQLGNAVTPPAARDLIAAVVEAITGEPLRLFDCSVPTDTAVAVLLTRGDRALSLRRDAGGLRRAWPSFLRDIQPRASGRGVQT